jgi:hypothetical protein
VAYPLSVSQRSFQPGFGVKNQTRLPGARPMLDVGLALDRVGDSLVEFHVDESLQGVSLSEAGYAAFAMFMSAPSDVGRYASVKNAVGAVRHDVNPAAGHLRIIAWMAGSSPAMTV